MGIFDSGITPDTQFDANGNPIQDGGTKVNDWSLPGILDTAAGPAKALTGAVQNMYQQHQDDSAYQDYLRSMASVTHPDNFNNQMNMLYSDPRYAQIERDRASGLALGMTSPVGGATGRVVGARGSGASWGVGKAAEGAKSDVPFNAFNDPKYINGYYTNQLLNGIDHNDALDNVMHAYAQADFGNNFTNGTATLDNGIKAARAGFVPTDAQLYKAGVPVKAGMLNDVLQPPFSTNVPSAPSPSRYENGLLDNMYRASREGDFTPTGNGTYMTSQPITPKNTSVPDYMITNRGNMNPNGLTDAERYAGKPTADPIGASSLNLDTTAYHKILMDKSFPYGVPDHVAEALASRGTTPQQLDYNKLLTQYPNRIDLIDELSRRGLLAPDTPTSYVARKK